jgi:hypothetical protein
MNTTRLLIRRVLLSHDTSQIRVPIAVSNNSSEIVIFLSIIAVSLTVQLLHQSSEASGDTLSSVINYCGNIVQSYQNIMKICKSSN